MKTPKLNTHQLVTAGLLVAMGLILPFVTAHAFGIPGNILLPMHIPVFLMGLICGPVFGLLGGLMIPLLSSTLTGMPAAWPMLPMMMGELAAYGLVSGLLYQKAKWSIYPAMLIAMVCGRAVYGLIFQALLVASNGTLQALSVAGAFVQGIPGIVIQLALVPLLVRLVAKAVPGLVPVRPALTAKKALAADPAPLSLSLDQALLDEAVTLIREDRASCVILRDGRIAATETGHGVRPLIMLYENDPELLKGSIVVDRIIGKAAAMLAVLGGAAGVYGMVMSNAGEDYLQGHAVPTACGRCVTIISNRTGDGLCPLEKSVMDITDPREGYYRLKDSIARLMAAAS